MKKNMGTVDRVLRLLEAVLLVVLYLTGVVSGVLCIICLIIALMFVVTSILGFCPLYVPLGINTGKKKE